MMIQMMIVLFAVALFDDRRMLCLFLVSLCMTFEEDDMYALLVFFLLCVYYQVAHVLCAVYHLHVVHCAHM